MKSGIETIDNKATDSVINRRREMLTRQFQYELKHKVELTNVKNSRHSLDRLFWFVYVYTDICTIESIKTDTLFEYLKYHHLEKFKKISFSEAVRDVNYFLSVRNKNISTSTLKVDLSLQNYNLWLRL